MPSTPARRAVLFDKSLELRNYDAAAIAATTAETAIKFAATKQTSYKAVVLFALHSGFVAGSAQWEIIIEAATTSGGTYVQIGKAVSNGLQARFDIPLSGEWVESLLTDASFVRARAVKVGAPGNLTYGAFLNLG
jgi:hypothetical protein